MFYDNFLELCNSVGEKPSAVALKLGISKATVSNWKRRKNGATDATALKIANYFGITVDELKTGTKKEPSIPTDEELGKNDAMWSAYDGVLDSTNGLSLHDTDIILKMLKDGGQGMTYNELLAFASALSKLPPERRQHLLHSADMLRQDKSEP